MPSMAHTGEPERYWERFNRLKRDKALSWSQLVRAAEGASISTFRAFAIQPPADGSTGRWRYPGPDTIADVAKALGISPDEFPEYRLAMARRALDERAPGNSLESALETLAVFELGQRVHADQQFGKPPTDLQREQGAQEFEADVEEAVRQRRGHLRSVGADEPSEDDQETRP